MEPFFAGETGGERANLFFRLLKESITELQRAYDDLLRDLQGLLLTAFDLTERGKLQVRAQAMMHKLSCDAGPSIQRSTVPLTHTGLGTYSHGAPADQVDNCPMSLPNHMRRCRG
jgi:hypothetical protein